jgi:hypothetical protein
VCLAALLPTLLVPIPAMVDYPNHLARMFVLARDGTSAAHPYYDVRWAMYPNLAMDLLVPPIGRVVGVETAARLFLLVSQLLIVSGSTVLELVVKRRLQLATLVATLFLYSQPFAWGFLNFQFGLGIALWGVASWWVLQERPPLLRLGVHALLVVVLFAAHLFALGVYGAVVGLLELWRARHRSATVRQTSARLLLLALPAVVLLAAMAVTGGSVGREGSEWRPAYKILWVLASLNGYSFPLSAGTTCLLAAVVWLMVRNRTLGLEPAGVWLVAGLSALYLVLPYRLRDTAFVDMRVLVAAALVLPAFTRLALPPSRTWIALRLGLVAVIAVNVGYVFTLWRHYRSEYAALMRSFDRLDRRARVLVGHSGAGDDPPMTRLREYPMYHAAVLAVHHADAFVPTLFTSVGKQPIVARAAVRHLDVPTAGPVPSALLTTIAESQAPAGTPAFVRSWHRDFDYLYLVGPRAPNPLPGVLQELDAGPSFVLFRIQKDAVASGAAP